MPVTLSIRNVPDDLAAKLKARAKVNHRSLNGEAILALQTHVLQGPNGNNLRQIADQIAATGLRTPSEAVQMIREDRDSQSH